MIPETIHPSIQSPAEHRLFQTIRDAPNTATWACLHSLSLTTHATKRRAEIDFVLLTHHGIFCLEAKGGRLKRRRGTWYSVDKQDQLHPLPESPFDQAATAMFSLQKRIRAQFKNRPQADALFGYGVLTPDILFDLDSPESDRRLVYDTRDTERPFTTYINRLAEFARAAEAREKRPALKPDAIEQLADFLRGDFDFIPSPARVIVDGGAGTGKTLLAIEAAQRMARDGKRVLFVCFNKLLAARIHARIATKQYAGELVVRNLHRLRQHGVRERLTLNCRHTRPIAFQTAVVSSARRRIKARVDGKPVRFTHYRKAPGWVSPLERVVADLRREQVPPGSISVLLTNKPSEDEQKALQRLGLVQLTEDHVPSLGTPTLTEITWSTVSGFKGLENDVVVLVGVKDIDDDWHQGVAYVGMSRARTGLHVIIREDCDAKRRERERELAEGRGSDVEMLL